MSDNLYYHLKSHERVSEFRFILRQAIDFPDSYHPILGSIGHRLHIEKKNLSEKQINLALKLIAEMKGRGRK